MQVCFITYAIGNYANYCRFLAKSIADNIPEGIDKRLIISSTQYMGHLSDEYGINVTSIHMPNYPFGFDIYKYYLLYDIMQFNQDPEDTLYVMLDPDSYILPKSKEWWEDINQQVNKDHKVRLTIHPCAPIDGVDNPKTIRHDVKLENMLNHKNFFYIYEPDYTKWVQSSFLMCAMNQMDTFMDEYTAMMRVMVKESMAFPYIPYMYDQSILNKMVINNDSYVLDRFVDNAYNDEMMVDDDFTKVQWKVEGVDDSNTFVIQRYNQPFKIPHVIGQLGYKDQQVLYMQLENEMKTK